MFDYGKLENRGVASAGPSRPEVPNPRQRFQSLPDPDPEDDRRDFGQEPLPVDERLSMRSIGYRARARSKSTGDAYRGDFEHFKNWCHVNTYRALPASPETVEFYLADHGDKLAISTLARRLVGIAHAHKKANHPTPTTAPSVREVFQGIRRAAASEGRSAPDQALPLLIDDIKEILEVLDTTSLIGLRDKAILLLGFAGAFRASEPGSIQVSDLTKHRMGYLVKLRKSKTDQEGTGKPIAIPKNAQNPALCPVQALDEWLKAAGIEEGPILRQVNRHGQAGKIGLTRHGVNYIIKRCVKAAGWETDGYSGHSLRAGLATTAHLKGVSREDIKRQGRWKSNVVDSYIRIAEAFTNNAAATAMK